MKPDAAFGRFRRIRCRYAPRPRALGSRRAGARDDRIRAIQQVPGRIGKRVLVQPVATGFTLQETLTRDTVEITRWRLSRVHLMNDNRYPWLILLPAVASITELHDLNASDQTILMAEITQASLALTKLHTPDKINVGALGNMVPQLHLHHIVRRQTDAAWPAPVWGKHAPVAYEDEQRMQFKRQLTAALSRLQG